MAMRSPCFNSLLVPSKYDLRDSVNNCWYWRLVDIGEATRAIVMLRAMGMAGAKNQMGLTRICKSRGSGEKASTSSTKVLCNNVGDPGHRVPVINEGNHMRILCNERTLHRQGCHYATMRTSRRFDRSCGLRLPKFLRRLFRLYWQFNTKSHTQSPLRMPSFPRSDVRKYKVQSSSGRPGGSDSALEVNLKG